MTAEPEQAKGALKQAAKGFALGGWMAFSFLLWGGLALAMWLGSGMAEPPPPGAGQTPVYVQYAVIALAFVLWCAATRGALRGQSPASLWLALLVAPLPVVLLLM
jgi:hypothetical protein